MTKEEKRLNALQKLDSADYELMLIRDEFILVDPILYKKLVGIIVDLRVVFSVIKFDL